jgi:hypothetical protein
MKQKRPSSRKPSKKRSSRKSSKKRTPRPPAPRPQPGPETLAWHTPLSEPPQQRRTSHAALLASSGIVEPPLPLRDAQDQASFTGEAETPMASAAREEMLSRIAVLEALMAEMPKQHIGIGHNQPPITREDVEEIKAALASLKAQQVVPAKANTAASVFKTVGKKIGSWVDAYMLQLAKSAAIATALAPLYYWSFFKDVVAGLAHSVTEWLQLIIR